MTCVSTQARNDVMYRRTPARTGLRHFLQSNGMALPYESEPVHTDHQ